MATCPDACESGACQHACRFCDETICKYNDPCLTRALEWIEKLERPMKWLRDCAKSRIAISPEVIESIVGEALDALEKLRAPVSPTEAERKPK